MTNNAANLLRLDWMGANDGVPYIETVAAATSISISAAWTEDNETTAVTEVSSSSASISWTEANDIAAAAIQAASASSLAWLEENETIAINVLAASDVSEWIITARRRGRR